ncbi:uncharacterized protein TrAtP1_011205 [Trichoderma atroviride]|uniref:uncharacterized protein n=1 Tax=Hypocrea atroviridis TaxID=63577 RepID=UPI0033299DA2|nr:hypothetical protein TrAtP1_011205 [Trichoderma atroviride]
MGEHGANKLWRKRRGGNKLDPSERGALGQRLEHLQRTIYRASRRASSAAYNGVKALWPAVVPAGPPPGEFIERRAGLMRSGLLANPQTRAITADLRRLWASPTKIESSLS